MKSIFSPKNLDVYSAELGVNWKDKDVIEMLQKFYATRSADTCFHCISDILGSLLIALNCKRKLRGIEPVDLSQLENPSLRAALIHRVGKA